MSFPGYDFAQAGAEISREFNWRLYCVNQDTEIHHLNWLGNPVYERSWTPPAVSLQYMLSDPKISKQADEWRLQSILSKATEYIDPVLVYVENGMDDLQLRGCELVRSTTGRVFKFYTPHGQWVNDSHEREEKTTIDHGDLYTYISSCLATGNGFAEICPIRCRSKWAEVRDERFEASRAFSGSLYRAKMRDRVYRPSPLRHFMIPDGLTDQTLDGHRNQDHGLPVDMNEMSDGVGALPTITSCNKSKGSLERRGSSPDLKSDGRIFEDLVQNRRSASFEIKYIESHNSNTRIEIHSSASFISGESTRSSEEWEFDTDSTINTDDSTPGIFQFDRQENAPDHHTESDSWLNSSQTSTSCEAMNSDTSETPHGNVRDDLLSEPDTSYGNEPRIRCANFSAVEFASQNASDVQFVSIRSQTVRRRRATLDDWKSKWKKPMVSKDWRQAPEKVRSAFSFSKIHQPNPSSSSPISPSLSTSSSSSTRLLGSFTQMESISISEKTVEVNIQGQQSSIESKFTQEYVSFPTPVFSRHGLSQKRKGAHHDSKKQNFVSKLSSKGRSFCRKIKDGFHRSSNNDSGTRNGSSWSTMVVFGCSAMGPYPCI